MLTAIKSTTKGGCKNFSTHSSENSTSLDEVDFLDADLIPFFLRVAVGFPPDGHVRWAVIGRRARGNPHTRPCIVWRYWGITALSAVMRCLSPLSRSSGLTKTPLWRWSCRAHLASLTSKWQRGPEDKGSSSINLGVETKETRASSSEPRRIPRVSGVMHIRCCGQFWRTPSCLLLPLTHTHTPTSGLPIQRPAFADTRLRQLGRSSISMVASGRALGGFRGIFKCDVLYIVINPELISGRLCLRPLSHSLFSPRGHTHSRTSFFNTIREEGYFYQVIWFRQK